MKTDPVTASPESQGIPSKAIKNMIEALEKNEIPMHSLLIARNQKLVLSAYYAPFGPGELHRMFSISKSFVSLAIGMLEQEGLISLDDPIAVYFPEYIPKNCDPRILSMTIREMLMMQTCHSSTTYKLHPNKNWVKSFFDTPPTHPSGTVFLYDTSSSHTLCALVEKLKKMPVLDYLKNCFLREIGFSEHSFFLKDPFGTSMGGSGLMAEPMDLLKLGLLLQNHGYASDGRSLIPELYLEKACSFQVCTMHTAPTQEESKGYGYQFWMLQHGGYACYGMGGQLLIVLPEENLVCVTTADTQEMKGTNQFIYNALYDCILPELSSTPLPESPKAQTRLKQKLSTLSLPILSGALQTDCPAFCPDHIYKIKEHNTAFKKFFLTFSSDYSEGKLHYYNNGPWHVLPFGLGTLKESFFPVYHQRCVSCAVWSRPDTLYIKCQLIGEFVGTLHFQFCFLDEKVFVYMKKTEETLFNEFQGFLIGESI